MVQTVELRTCSTGLIALNTFQGVTIYQKLYLESISVTLFAICSTTFFNCAYFLLSLEKRYIIYLVCEINAMNGFIWVNRIVFWKTAVWRQCSPGNVCSLSVASSYAFLGLFEILSSEIFSTFRFFLCYFLLHLIQNILTLTRKKHRRCWLWNFNSRIFILDKETHP